jgi:trk system potassium uptake protein TrkA
MKILVIGCGRLGAELAYRLFKQAHHVTVVDQTSAAFANLPADFRGRLLEGEVLSEDVLRRARMDEAEAVAVVTSSDAVNAVVGHVAREVFGVRHIAVRSFDPRRRDLLETFELPMVASTSWGAWRFEEMLVAPETRAVLSAGNGEVAVYELVVPESWSGRNLADFVSEAEVRPVALTRGGSAVLATPETLLETGDVLHFGATMAGANAIEARLGGPGSA